ncbi:MAG TPA: hypothetical protein P5107_07165 [Thermotogota bacterium]|nr:hypothetical protein [Thermotogota bacterium]HRW34818.1 hypothetical protein [Thermotogota bacterium]
MKKLKDIAYDAQYLKNLSDLRIKSKIIRTNCSREHLKNISKKDLHTLLKRCDKGLFETLRLKETLSIIIALDEILYGKGKFHLRLAEALKILECDDWTLAPFLFYTAPRFFYFPSASLFNYAKRSMGINISGMTYLAFNALLSQKIKGTDLADYFKDPIELEAAFKTLSNNESSASDKTNPFLDSQDIKIQNEIVHEVQQLDPYRLKAFEIKWIKEFYSTLEPAQKDAMIESLKAHAIHPYLRRIITQTPKTGLVIDGSNIIFSGLIEPDPLRLKELLNVLGITDTLYFPLLFVFDANADFIINKKREYWEKNFLNNPNVSFYSPADELVIKIAYEKKYHIISNDKYRDYNAEHVTIFQFRPDRGEFYLKKTK